MTSAIFSVSIRTTAKEINALHAMFVRDQLAINDMKHTLAVSTLYLAAKDGDCKPLNAFFHALGENDKSAFALWINRTMTQSDKWTHGVNGKFIKLIRKPDSRDANGNPGYFSMVSDVMKLRTAWMKLAEDQLIHATNETSPERHFLRFFVKENVAETAAQSALFGDVEVLKALDRLIKNFEKDNSVVSNTTQEILLNARKTVEAIATKTVAQANKEEDDEIKGKADAMEQVAENRAAAAIAAAENAKTEAAATPRRGRPRRDIGQSAH
jgi:hypothetical protein